MNKETTTVSICTTANPVKDINELKQRVQSIQSHDSWYASPRVETDGKAGNVLEDLLGIAENNRRGADVVCLDGAECEIKTSKSEGTSITLACLAPEYCIPQIEGIERYGITKSKQPDTRRFYSTNIVGEINPRGLKTEIEDDFLIISDNQTNEEIMKWPVDSIIDKLKSKCYNVVYTKADKTKFDKKEAFKYKDSKYYESFNSEKARVLLTEGKIKIDTRSKIVPSGKIRDRGTAFRIPQRHLPELYDNIHNW
jgi:hypothetical protein